MAKKTDKGKSLYESSEDKKIYDRVLEHYEKSWDDLVSPNIAGFTEKEGMYLQKHLDSITNEETKAGVYDPRLATMSLERCGRVMAQNPSGKSLAMSADDRGKNMLMNMLQDKWVLPNANSQYTFLIKNRLWDFYSLMYGVMWALVDQVNTDNYSGPDLWLLPIRHCRPQPGRFSIKDSDYFGVSTWVTKEWLMARNKDSWHNIDKLLLKIKDFGSKPPGENDNNQRSLVENERQPNVVKEKDFKLIEVYTEYRPDRWITICPDYKDSQLVLRDIENPHKNDKIPVVAKYCFPMIDSIYGLGEFERGKTLQYALNSLWNLYLDGVKMSIFPPIQMVADDVVPSSILMEPAAKWLLTKPNSKIETFNASPQGIQTFQNTYQFLLGAIQHLGGSSDTTISKEADLQQGKTPEALKMQAARENTRDSWDRFMMEESLEEVMNRFVNLTVTGLDKNVELRLFSKEIQEIQSLYPDVVELVEGADRGIVKVSKKLFDGAQFDYQITKGSTYKAEQDQEAQNIQSLLNFTLNPNIYPLLMQSLQAKGKKIDIGELYQRSIISSGIQDWEKIVVDVTQEDLKAQQLQGQNQQTMQQLAAKPGSMEEYMANQMGPGMPKGPEAVQPPQSGPLSGKFQDPAIQQFADQMFGGGQ